MQNKTHGLCLFVFFVLINLSTYIYSEFYRYVVPALLKSAIAVSVFLGINFHKIEKKGYILRNKFS